MAANAAKIGRILEGRYQIRRLLGEGAQAQVYLAWDQGLGRWVAIKRPFEQNLVPGYVTQFRREAKLHARFEHPNAIRIHDYCEPRDDLPFLVMEYLKGPTLLEVIEKKSDAVPPKHILRFVKDICSAMQKAHEAGIVHRDIKPGNVILANEDMRDERFVLLDLGVAKLVDLVGHGATLADIFGNGAGTLAYMSPEQFDSGETDSKSDIYAVGVTLFQLWTGSLPFEPPTDNRGLFPFMSQVIQASPPVPSEVAPDRNIPAKIEGLILQCLAKDPEARPGSMQELKDRYQSAWRKSLSPVGPPPVPPVSNRKMIVWGVSLLVAVCLIMLGARAVTPKPKPAWRPPTVLDLSSKPHKAPNRFDLAWRLIGHLGLRQEPPEFYVLETKVWNDLYWAYSEETKAGTEWQNGTWKPGDRETRGRLPVSCVTALEADAFCRWLAVRLSASTGPEGKPLIIHARLPTRKEYSQASGYDAWSSDNPQIKELIKGAVGPFTGEMNLSGKATPVGSIENQGARPWSVKDMAANGLEWTDDFRGPDRHLSTSDVDPTEMIEVRGHSWHETKPLLYTNEIFRAGATLFCNTRDPHVGFRVVLEIPKVDQTSGPQSH